MKGREAKVKVGQTREMDRDNKIEIQMLMQYICQSSRREREGEESSLGINQYRLLTCIIVRSYGANIPRGIYVCCSTIPNPSGRHSSLLYSHISHHIPADQEHADVQSFQ